MTHPLTTRTQLMHDLAEELDRAEAKFPGPRCLLAALLEEVGELAQELLGATMQVGGQTPEEQPNVRGEAIQVACVALRIAATGDDSYPPATMTVGEEIPDGWGTTTRAEAVIAELAMIMGRFGRRRAEGKFPPESLVERCGSLATIEMAGDHGPRGIGERLLKVRDVDADWRRWEREHPERVRPSAMGELIAIEDAQWASSIAIMRAEAERDRVLRERDEAVRRVKEQQDELYELRARRGRLAADLEEARARVEALERIAKGMRVDIIELRKDLEMARSVSQRTVAE